MREATYGELKWIILSHSESSAVKALAWKRYPSQATVTRVSVTGYLYILFRNRSQYMYVYYNVPYLFFYRLVSGRIKSIGNYINRFLHQYRNGWSRYEYKRKYI